MGKAGDAIQQTDQKKQLDQAGMAVKQMESMGLKAPAQLKQAADIGSALDKATGRKK